MGFAVALYIALCRCIAEEGLVSSTRYFGNQVGVTGLAWFFFFGNLFHAKGA